MKKLTTVLIATSLFAINSFAQKSTEGFSKGSIFASGQVGFVTAKQDQVKGNGFNINPRLGYFVSNNIAVGINVGFASIKAEDGATIDQHETSTSFGVFGRYYFTPANKFSFFGNLGVDYTTSKDKLANPEIKTNGFGVSVSPGISYFLSNNLAIETSIGLLGYKSEKVDLPGAKALNTFQFNLGLSNIAFGINYKF